MIPPPEQASAAKRPGRVVRLGAALGVVLVSVALVTWPGSEPPDPAPSRVLAAKGAKWNFLAARRNFAAALCQADSISDESAKAALRWEIANAQVKAGDMAGAQASAATITDIFEKATLLRLIAKTQAEAGDVAGAKATAATIADTCDKVGALQDIAEAQAKAGDLAGAKATAATITSAEAQSRALRAIARAQSWAEGHPAGRGMGKGPR